jgi:hypothetical protein
LTNDPFWQALLPAAYLGIHLIEGEFGSDVFRTKSFRRFERLLTPNETQQLLIRIFHRHEPRWWRAGRRPWRYK